MQRTNSNINYLQDTEELARFAKALAHPTRIKIIKYLSEQSFCHTGDLMDYLPLAQSTISQHLKELKEAGLIKGEINPPKVKYCINQDNWAKAKTLFCDFFDIHGDEQPCCI
jgi:predicted transcriptional regulator